MCFDKGGQQVILASSWSEFNEDKNNRSKLELTSFPPPGLHRGVGGCEL